VVSYLASVEIERQESHMPLDLTDNW